MDVGKPGGVRGWLDFVGRQLGKKTFKEDIDRCPKCGGKMKLQ